VSLACPKCGHERTAESLICERCGVVFAKLRERAPAGTGRIPVESCPGAGLLGERPGVRRVMREWLFDVPPEEVRPFLVGRGILYLLLLTWGWRFLTSSVASGYAAESPLHLILLPFHEAGHVIFGVPGIRFLMVLGGTLGQLLVPAIVTGAFVLRRDRFGGSVGLWWLGQSFMDVAVYADDARAGKLPLLGGVTGGEVEDYHDWEVMLGKLGWLPYDHLIARLMYGGGCILMIGSLAWGGFVLWRQSRPIPPGAV